MVDFSRTLHPASAILGAVLCASLASARPADAQSEAAQTGVAVAGCANGSADAWRHANYDLNGSGYNRAERKLSPSNLGRLKVDWTFDADDAGHPVAPIHATPAVEDGRSYVGDFGGNFYAIGPDGNLLWETVSNPPNPIIAALFADENGVPPPHTPFYAGAVLAEKQPYVIFGDAQGYVYAHHKQTGSRVWSVKVDPHPMGGIAGNSISVAGDRVFIGLSSTENFALALQEAGVPIQCCSHLGGIVALDLKDGRQLWRHDTIPPNAVGPLPARFAPLTQGPSGADIWAQPTYDAETNTIYVGTGQNFSPDAQGRAAPESDSIMALNADTGAVRWRTQFYTDDIWVTGFPNPTPAGTFVDKDIGDAVKVYRLDGRRVVGAGQKDGNYRILDAVTGAIVKSVRIVDQANGLGGLQTGGALTGDTVFQHGLHALVPPAGDATLDTPFAGRVAALTLGGRVKWQRDYPMAPLAGGLAVANGVVYFMSPRAENVAAMAPPEWALYALRADSGAELKRIAFAGRALTSPAVAGGHVYLSFGNAALPQLGPVPQGGMMRFGLPQ